ncbi:NAD-dependent epimerase/dehydratase family protein [Rariglobus hedericola]|uniref:NAD-dependent epimerase/dehydratase family protein n=1 Tax=Rariglobus hedericola TaxID=2597822 RepID=A0A556QJ58_9BACT|nr:NAD-dependent epimerase/dehydratase family protein [Rariglobus hedericola]TSJ76657.1 NAD-dependent epimerase/dehydratase family protein [Rariglobus hedericola]
MKLLITGICGFVGSTLARSLVKDHPGVELLGLDNFIRPGSETNRAELKALGVHLFHGDLRNPSDLEVIPPADFVIDAAANPSVLAGVDGRTSSRQLVEHNLLGTINLLEYCKRHRAGFILLSTSRVYSIPPLANLAIETHAHAFRPSSDASLLPAGLTSDGVSETFATTAPVSLYGSTKLASEALAVEYGETFQFPVFINRCGVLAGAGQFGRADQGIFAYWINRYLRGLPLNYIGFDGQGHQVRDCLHPRDLVPLLRQQIDSTRPLNATDRIINVSGGARSAHSLCQLSAWCSDRFGPREVTSDPKPRPFDIPWMVLDSAKAARLWNWQPATPAQVVLEEIAVHAEAHPEWLELSASF